MFHLLQILSPSVQQNTLPWYCFISYNTSCTQSVLLQLKRDLRGKNQFIAKNLSEICKWKPCSFITSNYPIILMKKIMWIFFFPKLYSKGRGWEKYSDVNYDCKYLPFFILIGFKMSTLFCVLWGWFELTNTFILLLLTSIDLHYY